MEERRLRDCSSTMGSDRRPRCPDAQFYLGFMNEYGQGVPRNSVEAINWIAKPQIKTTLSRNSVKDNVRKRRGRAA